MEPPRKPAQIAEYNFDVFEIITQTNIKAILKDIGKGDKEPLNHVCLPYTDYLSLAKWMDNIEAYQQQSEKYFKQVEDAYSRVENKD